MSLRYLLLMERLPIRRCKKETIAFELRGGRREVKRSNRKSIEGILIRFILPHLARLCERWKCAGMRHHAPSRWISFFPIIIPVVVDRACEITSGKPPSTGICVRSSPESCCYGTSRAHYQPATMATRASNKMQDDICSEGMMMQWWLSPLMLFYTRSRISLLSVRLSLLFLVLADIAKPDQSTRMSAISLYET